MAGSHKHLIALLWNRMAGQQQRIKASRMALVDIAMGVWRGVECVHIQVLVIAAVSDGFPIYPMLSNTMSRLVTARLL